MDSRQILNSKSQDNDNQEFQQSSSNMNYSAAAALENLKNPQPKTYTAPNNSDLNKNPSFSRRPVTNVNNDYTPKRQSAIILENIQNVTQDQCLRAVADVIGGANIHYCSRLSGARICLYLTNETHVNKMCDKTGININSEFIPCRRYVTEAKKVVISNCPPEMTDQTLKNIMEQYGRIVSAPTRLRVSTAHEDLRHVKTWRRVIYLMIPHDAPEMPTRIQITSTEGLKQTLYVEADDEICKFCRTSRGVGHTYETCKRRQEQQEEDFPAFQPPAQFRLTQMRTKLNTKTNTENLTSSLMPSFSEGTAQITSGTISSDPVSPVSSQSASQNPPQETQNKEKLSSQEHPKESQIQEDMSSQEKTHPEVPEDMPINDNHNPVDTDTDASMSSQNISDLTSNEIFEKITRKRKKKTKRLLSPESTVEDPSITKLMKITEDKNLTESQENTSDCESIASNESGSSSQSDRRRKNEQEILKTIMKNITFQDEVLSADKFLEFMKDCRGKANSKIVAQRINANVTELIKKINEAYLKCTDFNLQRRLKRASEALTPHESEW